ncbi:MAG: hypothetical protein WAT71_04665 [Ignavibacteria bacterium]
MKKNKFLSLSILISIFIISFFDLSCDNATDPVSGVSGTIHNKFHFPLANIKVSSQGQTVLTSEDGRFNLSGISMPYDLIVSDSTFNLNVDIYKGLNISDLNLEFRKYLSKSSYAYIDVQLPPEIFQPGVTCEVIYSDKEYTNIYSTLISSNQNAILQVPVFNNVIKGKIYVLTYKADSSYRIISYENYGVSPDIEVSNGDAVNYTFTIDQLSLNPGEKVVECIIETNNIVSFGNFYLTFSPKNYIYTNTTFFSQLLESKFHVKIPTGIPDAFYSIIYYNIGNTDGNISLDPNTSNYLKLNSPCELLSPANNAVNVNNNTTLTFSTGEGSGVYEIYLYNNTSFITTNYRIFTSENNFTLKGLEEAGYENFSGDNFTWLVLKKGTFSSLNDYAVNKFNIQNTFISQSHPRYFTFE